jgi:hypothetical protein
LEQLLLTRACFVWLNSQNGSPKQQQQQQQQQQQKMVVAGLWPLLLEQLHAVLKQLLRIDAKDEVHREMFRYWLQNRTAPPAEFLGALSRMYCR